MYLFKKKETLLQSIAYMALMITINIIISLFASFFPIISLLFVFILPLTSVLVTLFTKWRYYPIYLCACLLGASLATMYNLEFTIFYLFPSTLSGFILGMFIERKYNMTCGIIIASIIHAALSILFIPLINFIFQIDIVKNMLALAHLSNKNNIYLIIPAFITIFSLIEMILSYIIIYNEISKLGYKDIKISSNIYIVSIFLFSSLLIPIFNLFCIEISYIIFALNIFYGVVLSFEIIMSLNVKKIIIISSFFISSLIIFLVLFQYMNILYSIQLLNVFPLLVYIYYILVVLLQLRHKKNIMVNEANK